MPLLQLSGGFRKSTRAERVVFGEWSFVELSLLDLRKAACLVKILGCGMMVKGAGTEGAWLSLRGGGRAMWPFLSKA